MRVLVAHNRYQEAGGEDSVFANEVELLRRGGCEVETLVVSNDVISGWRAKASAALRVVWNTEGRRLVADAIARIRPDVLHVHNFFPRLSPALFDASEAVGVPTVWTLHNYRVACANGLLFRDARPCEACIGRAPIPALRYRCYRGSVVGTAAVAAMIGYHQAAGTWRRKVDRFIALNTFAADLFERAGVPKEKIAIKANFIEDPLPNLITAPAKRAGAVFVGRLSAEKGVATLVEAWRHLPSIPLTILGEGPERPRLEAIAPSNVRFLGFQPTSKVMGTMASAEALIVPSVWYENFPMTVVEAMALGTPVIASRIGALSVIIRDGIDGLHFAPGDPADLARVTKAAFAEPGVLNDLGRGARAIWETSMSPASNLAQLMAIYRDVIRNSGEVNARVA
jgi:glycosyltransferase involved in cell wall biosynthesis